MNCKCNWVESILAIIIIIFAYMGSASSRWVIIIAAVLLLLHALMCKKCGMCEEPEMMESKHSKKRRR
ncbi:MAG: hypothetical protein AABX23_03000 [Nanoarchaeota archaeon]